LQSVRDNGKREDVDLLQCLLFFNVGKLVVQIACPRALITDVHDDGIFGDDPAISLNDRGGIDLVDQHSIHSRANVQTSCNLPLGLTPLSTAEKLPSSETGAWQM